MYLTAMFLAPVTAIVADMLDAGQGMDVFPGVGRGLSWLPATRSIAVLSLIEPLQRLEPISAASVVGLRIVGLAGDHWATMNPNTRMGGFPAPLGIGCSAHSADTQLAKR